MAMLPLKDWPAIAGPTEWSRTIERDVVTIYRADVLHRKLKRLNPGAPRPLYSITAICDWLCIPREEIPEALISRVEIPTPGRRKRTGTVGAR